MTVEQTPRQVADGFGTYVDAQKARLEGLRAVMEAAVPVISDVNRINDALLQAGRPDLTMTVQASMMPIDGPDQLLGKAGNFTPNFRIHMGVTKRFDEAFGKERIDPIPATREALERFRTGVGSSWEDIVELEGEDEDLRDRLGNVASKAAFQRMLVLFPEFTIPFVLEFSKPENRNNRDARFEAELFVAYQLMSRLVDEGDKYVKKGDDWYLCH